MSPLTVREQADYGIDAPEVVRNLFAAAITGLVLWSIMKLGFWDGFLVVPLGSVRLAFPLGPMGFGTGVLCAAMAICMLWSSKVGKLREREKLLDLIAWKGTERVLDVGCGRGLMLIGAAKRLTTGKASGIDIWQTEDLSGNNAEAAKKNAQREGVGDRADIRTADMRRMPFDDETFDVIVSRAVIHNLYSRNDRAQAIREIARVLKPGGVALIEDIRHHNEYVSTFGENRCTDVRWIGSPFVRLFLAVITFGGLRPATLLVRKD